MFIAIMRDTRAIAMLDPDPAAEIADELELVEIADAERDKFNRSAVYHLATDNATVEVTPVVQPIEDPLPTMLPYLEVVAKLNAIESIAEDGDSAPRLRDAVVDLARVTRQVTHLLRDSLKGMAP